MKEFLGISILTAGILFCLAGCSEQKTSPGVGKTATPIVNQDEQDMEAKIQAIISQKGDVNQRERDIPLLTWAIEKRYVNCVKLLLENKADPEIPPLPRSTDTPLMGCSSSLDLAIPETETLFLTEEKSGKIMALLIAHQAKVNHRNGLDETPLHKAALVGRDDLCLLLINAGADVDAQDKLGNTPLHAAARGGYFKAVRLLVDKGARPLANKLGKTPLDLAATREDEKLHEESRAINKNFYRLCDYDQTIAVLR